MCFSSAWSIAELKIYCVESGSSVYKFVMTYYSLGCSWAEAHSQCTLPHRNVQGFNGYQEVTNENLITLYEPTNPNLQSVHAKLLQSYPTLCNPMDCSPSGSSVHGIFQAGTLEWGAISFSRGYSRHRDWTASPASPASAGRFFTTASPGGIKNHFSGLIDFGDMKISLKF